MLGDLWRRRQEHSPVLIVIDEAHNVCPAEPPDPLVALAAEHAIRIAAEGRKACLNRGSGAAEQMSLAPSMKGAKVSI